MSVDYQEHMDEFCPECQTERRRGDHVCPVCGYIWDDPTVECPFCGEFNYDDADRCSACGKSLVKKAKDGNKFIKLLPIFDLALAAVAIVLGVLIFISRGKTRYEVVIGPSSWVEANVESQEHGGRLAAPKDENEMKELITLLNEKSLDGARLFVSVERLAGTENFYLMGENRNLIGEAVNKPVSWANAYWDEKSKTTEEYKYAVLKNVGDGWKLESCKDTIDGKEIKGCIISYG